MQDDRQEGAPAGDPDDPQQDATPARDFSPPPLPIGTADAPPPVVPHQDPAEESAPAETPKVDPWAHRRGEPRIFALLWTIFLFVGSVMIFYRAVVGPTVSPELMRPAAQMLLMVMAGGMSLLWPMVRLSQTPEPHPLSGAFQDLIVIMLPAQALIWPQTLWWLARWPVVTVLALAAGLAVWGLFTAGLVALSQTGGRSEEPRPLRNAGWMLIFIGVALGGPVVSLVRGWGTSHPGPGDLTPGSIDPATMLSPLGMVLELTRDGAWSGHTNLLTPEHWYLIGVVGAAAALVWIIAAVRSQRAQKGLRLTSEN